jgi:hypothetical protein
MHIQCMFPVPYPAIAVQRDLTYGLYVPSFSVYEDNVSESRASSITLVIGTSVGAKVFGVDNHDTLITKAALHGANRSRKPSRRTGSLFDMHVVYVEFMLRALSLRKKYRVLILNSIGVAAPCTLSLIVFGPSCRPAAALLVLWQVLVTAT